MHRHIVLVPKVLTFTPEYKRCPYCHRQMEKHINCEGARFHVHSYSNLGIRCSERNCEDNHGLGKCVPEKGKPAQ